MNTRLLGIYRTPKFRYGDVVVCEVRGEVVITGLTDAPCGGWLRCRWPRGCRLGPLQGDQVESVPPGT